MTKNVEDCPFYNDHDCSEPECGEILDDRFLAIYLCRDRKNCDFKSETEIKEGE